MITESFEEAGNFISTNLQITLLTKYINSYDILCQDIFKVHTVIIKLLLNTKANLFLLFVDSCHKKKQQPNMYIKGQYPFD